MSSPLTSFERARQMYKNPQYLEAFSYDLTFYLLKDIEYRMNNGLNFILEIAGEPGSGKTYLGATLNEQLQKNLGHPGICPENICFKISDAIELNKKYKKKWTIQVDEQKREYFGEGAFRELSGIQDLEDIVRKSQTNFIFISPEPRGYHSGLHFILRTWWIEKETRETYALLFRGSDVSLIEPLGFIKLKLPETQTFIKTMEEYENRKDKFIDETKEGTTRENYFKELRRTAEKLSVIKEYPETPTKANLKALFYLHHPDLIAKYSLEELDTIINMTMVLRQAQ